MPKNEYIEEATERGISLPWLANLQNRLAQASQNIKEGRLMQYLPHALYVVMLGVVYIGNRHHVDRVIREIDAVKLEVEDLRADYMNAKSSYMYSLKRTEIRKKVHVLGLREEARPPEVIYIEGN